MPDTGEQRPPTEGDTGQHPGPTAGNSRRLTYAQIAARLGISGDAARILVRRRGWRRIMPNRKGGVATIVVPEGALDDEDWRHDGEIPPTRWRQPWTTRQQPPTAASWRALSPLSKPPCCL